jgi:Tfp pilus assembly protein PilO
MNMSRREQALAAVAVLLTAVFVAYAFAILPAVERYRHQGELIQEKTRRAALLEQELERAGSLEKRHREARERMARDRGRKVTAQSLFATLQELAGPMDVRVTGVSPLPPKEQPYYREIAVVVDVESSLEPLVHFLYEIEREDSGISVQRLVIAPAETGGPALRCQVQAAARVFHGEDKKP